MAIQSLIIILLVLAGLLVLGVPISYAIGISSLAAIVRIMPLDVAVLTAAHVGCSAKAAMVRQITAVTANWMQLSFTPSTLAPT